MIHQEQELVDKELVAALQYVLRFDAEADLLDKHTWQRRLQALAEQHPLAGTAVGNLTVLLEYYTRASRTELSDVWNKGLEDVGLDDL